MVDDYVKLLTVMEESKRKTGLRKYIDQLTKRRCIDRNHATWRMKADDTVKWWSEIGECCFGFVFTYIKLRSREIALAELLH